MSAKSTKSIARDKLANNLQKKLKILSMNRLIWN